jgi:hypothetical protein
VLYCVWPTNETRYHLCFEATDCTCKKSGELPTIDVLRPHSTLITGELEKYDKRVTVYYDAKAWANTDVTQCWLENFITFAKAKATLYPSEVMLGLDNYECQKTDEFVEKCEERDIALNYTPPNCTDICSVTDYNLGILVKNFMRNKYQADYESRTDAWVDGLVTSSERRVLYSSWLGEAWEWIHREKLDTIMTAFKRCGQCNKLDGSENSEVRIPRFTGFYDLSYPLIAIVRINEFLGWNE